jgi:4-hydroxy-tetrahydrodipicolinate reductase
VTIRVGVVGVAGRMGAQLVKAVHEAPGLTLAAAIDRRDSAAMGSDAGVLAGLAANGVLVQDDLRAALKSVDVVVDFSRADAAASSVDACVAARVAMMIGTTGLDATTLAAIDRAAQHIPILVSANTSLALNVLLDLVQRAARALPTGYDIEIIEAHHRHKVDAPSGTALVLGEAAAAGRGESLPRPIAPTGSQPGARTEGGIGFAVVRGGDVVGEHEVRFLGAGEQLRMTHIATDRAIFARGAVAAAAWLVGRSPGRYQMADFLLPKQ